jgi:hypothetical protein
MCIENEGIRERELLMPTLPMIAIPPQTRLFQPSLLDPWSWKGSLAMVDSIVLQRWVSGKTGTGSVAQNNGE